MAGEMTVEDVLRTMDELSHYQEANIEGKTLQKWLEVLRQSPVQETTWRLEAERLREVVRNLEGRKVDAWGPQPEQGLVERWPVVSSLPVAQLRDMRVKAQLDVDHEGGGTIEINYGQVPEQHRLQALIQMMAAISLRIELAVGTESFINMLRGRADRLERGR